MLSHISIQAHISLHKYTHMLTCTGTYTFNTHTHVHLFILTITSAHVNLHRCTHTHIYSHRHTHAYIFTKQSHAHTDIHAYTHAYHAHMHSCLRCTAHMHANSHRHINTCLPIQAARHSHIITYQIWQWYWLSNLHGVCGNLCPANLCRSTMQNSGGSSLTPPSSWRANPLPLSLICELSLLH